MTGAKEKSGGRRPGSGRPKKFGDLRVKRIVRMVPVAWIDDLDKWLENRRLEK